MSALKKFRLECDLGAVIVDAESREDANHRVIQLLVELEELEQMSADAFINYGVEIVRQDNLSVH